MNAVKYLVLNVRHAVLNFPMARNVTIKLTMSKSPNGVRN